MSGAYDVRLASAAERAYKKLDDAARARVRSSLEQLAVEAGGKSSKTIHGRADSFHRRRVGDHRVMYDVIDDDRVVLVLGIVHHRDLERWLRSR